jgi:tRNA pseudouridine38-40 synthase
MTLVSSSDPGIYDYSPVPVSTRVGLVIEYDGTEYYGFQWQKKQITVQQEIEGAILKLTGETLRVVSASRTDTGVHAIGQVITFRTHSLLPLKNFITGLNHFLPASIAVKSAFYPEAEFHVQKSAVSRQYDYYILNSPVRSALWQRYTYQVPEILDIELMKEAGKILEGEHDFASFTSTDAVQLKNTVRNVYRTAFRKDGEIIIFTIEANSFLAHQVRNTVGMLVQVGLNKMSLAEFYSIMERKKPGLAGPRVPARGLRLVRVNYPYPIKEEANENI